MRFDTHGFFWQDAVKARGERIDPFTRPAPPVPATKWQRPRSLPDLSAADAISFDLEGYDPELTTHGPGWARGRGNLIGVSVGTYDGAAWYIPFRHTFDPESNFEPEVVLRWLQDQLGRPHQPKVGANLLYDVGWLQQEGVRVRGKLYDVQFAEALLSEAPRVGLDELGRKYLGRGKAKDELTEWLVQWVGGYGGTDKRKFLHRAPASLVGPYAEEDVRIPLEVLSHQWPELERQGLLELFEMECGLIPLLVAMRFAGVPVDVGRAEQARDLLLGKEQELLARLRDLCGFEVNPNAGDSIARAFRHHGLPYNTKQTKGVERPTFDKAFLATVQHPLAELVLETRKVAKVRSTFVESYILKAHVEGYIYPQFHPLRGSDNGTRSGRFASSDPNYQNLPSRDPWLGPLVRGLCVPDAALGHTQWRRYDYSQIEYRFFAHYATGDGADGLRQQYRDNPKTDYHEHTLDLVAPVAGWDVSTPEGRKRWRKPVKNINFGLLYGMGIAHLAEVLALPVRAARGLFDQYHKAVPFTRETLRATGDEAGRLGHITTILGRRSRFDLWEPAGRHNDADDADDGRAPALPYAAALAKYGRIRRAYLHKALNRRLQGSAADLMKRAMLRAWQDGIFAETGVPRLTVHDELDFSDPGNKDAAFRELAHVLETAIPLRVPVLVDMEVGPSWGDCK